MRRSSRMLVAIGLVAASTMTVLATSAGPAAAACSLVPTRDADARPGVRGPIGVLGDSTTIGMIVYGDIVGQLAAQGWGPIRAEAFCGGRTADGGWSGITALTAWRADGFDPPVLLMGFGSNDVGFCQLDGARCRQRIENLLDVVGSRATVWPTITHNDPSWEASWNDAMNGVAISDPLMSIVDWKALVDGDPSLVGADRVHARDAAAYVRRAAQLVDGATPWASSRAVATAPPTAAPTAPAAGFAPLATPMRVLDTRQDGTPLVAGATLVIDLAPSAPPGVVTGATTAAAVNLTVDRAASDGYLTAWSCEGAVPPTSAVNFPAGVARAAHSIVPIANGRFCIRASTNADLVVDLSGTYATGAALRYTATAPTRLLDSRDARPLVPAGTVTTVHLASGAGEAPAAAMLNLVATDATAPGYLTAYPCDSPMPDVSSVNLDSAATRANVAQVRSSATGDICVFNSSPMSVVVDQMGIYRTTGLRYQPVVPTRLLDTRVGLGGWLGATAPGQTLTVAAASPAGTGVVLTVTSTAGPDAGYVTAHPCAADATNVSTSNHGANETVANTASIVGAACVTAQHRDQLVVDVIGRWVA